MQQIIIVGIVPIVVLVIVSLVVINLRKWWPSNQKWIKVMAMVTAVDQGQDWKYGERSIRDSWSGNWVKEKTWQSYYAVTAQWIDPQTQHRYVFSGRCWVNKASAPDVGTTIPVAVHSPDPSRYEMLFEP